MQWLNGKKTYIVGAILVFLSGLKAQGFIDDNIYNLVFNSFVGLGLVTLRMGMRKK